MEYTISIAASLAHYFIKQKRAVGFVTEEQKYTMIPAERSERQENKILETLAYLQGKGDLSISELVSAQTPLLPQGSGVILLTPTTSLDLIIAANNLQRRNLRPIVILLVAETFDGRKGTDEVATRLMEQKTPICLIHCGEDLSIALSNFPSNNISQDSSKWQRPTLSHLI